MSGRPKAIDLFAGPGGLSLGLTLSGFDVVGAVEWDPQAGKTYSHNIGNHVHVGDIKDLPPREMERILKKTGSIRRKSEIQLISGGPPCPGFSLVGRSKIANLIKTGEWEGSDFRHSFIDDPRNGLFREFLRYVDHFKPKRFLMENVTGMSSYKDKDERPIISVIKKEFESIGYKVDAEVLDASDFGVPQSRKRVIFLGSKGKRQAVRYPMRLSGKISARQAVRDLPMIDTKTGLPPNNLLKRIRRSGHSGKLLRWLIDSRTPSGLKSEKGFCTLHHTRPVNPRDQAIFQLIESGEYGKRVLYKDVFPSRLDEVAKLVPEGYSMELNEPGRCVVGSPWGHRKTTKWGWYDPSKYGDKMRRIRGDRPAPTIVAHLAKDGYMFIHPDEDRTITVREAARFQSFPDSFDFSSNGQNSISSQFRQVGNAVPPLLAMALGEQILISLGLEAENSIGRIFS